MATTTHAALPDERNHSVWIFVDGEWLRRADAKISVFDSAFLVGDGVWEGLRYHDGVFVHLDRHLDRLFSSAAGVHLDIGKTRAELTALLQEIVDRNEMKTDAHVRMMVTRGTKRTPLQDPRLVDGGPNIVIIALHKKPDPAVSSIGIRLTTSTVRRPPPETLDQRWNCHSKIHEVVALMQAIEAGTDEALMLDPNGNVATCNSTNFFIVTDGEVWTSSGEFCLNGITRNLVLELAAAEGLIAHEKNFTLDDVYQAEESFVTGTFGGLTPVVEVDGHMIGDGSQGPITARLSVARNRAFDTEALAP
ncbi:MAG: aminotransferase class IV [Actinomycetia bacterium]|nr:aminotransferase class IV [Actinomycetes bacterium]